MCFEIVAKRVSRVQKKLYFLYLYFKKEQLLLCNEFEYRIYKINIIIIYISFLMQLTF